MANGDEKFVLIGNFLSNQEMEYKVFDENLLETRYTSPMAYYYIDDVQLMLYDSLVHKDCGAAVLEAMRETEGVAAAMVEMGRSNDLFSNR